MRNSHIIEILDSAPLSELSEAQIVAVRAHIESCPSCARAYQAASMAAQVIHARAAIEIEPSPFFATKVLAGLREKRAATTPVMLRLWRSANYVVSSMAITTAALAFLSFVVPDPATNTSENAVTAFSAESVILGDEEELSYEQVLSTIYAENEEAK